MAFAFDFRVPSFSSRYPGNSFKPFTLAVLLLLFLWGIPAAGQYTTASFGGTVLDPAGAVVPEASVTVQNEGTGLTRTVTTLPNGEFLFPALPVGNYRLTVTKQGFATYVQTGIVLTVNQAATQTVSLKVGAVTQEVTVAANAQVLTTRTATLSQLVDQKKIVDLPLNGRQAQSLLFLAAGTLDETGVGPGYCLANCEGGVYPGEQDASVSGLGTRGVNYQMDGAGHNDTYLNANLPFPNPDAVQEFNVQDQNLSAQYGRGGAVVNIVTKSGTNDFHGDVFEFLRNGALNARNFYAPTQDTLKRNQFGGSVGGPIVKDKLFFFGTYQGTRIRSAAQGQIAFVPTAAERNGDFSDIPDPLVNPSTSVPYAGNQIPTTDFSAPSNFFLQHIPLPNGPGRQLTFAGPSVVQNDDQWMTKVDWIHGKNQLSGSYFWTKFNEPPDLVSSQTNILAADGSGNQVKVQNLSLNHTYSFSPTILFNTWFGWDSQTGGSLSGAPYGFPDAGVQIAAPTPPEMSLYVDGSFGFETNHLGDFGRGDWTIHEDVTWQRGSHELHFGGDIVRLKNHLVNEFTMSGEFEFGNQLSGSNLTDFFLGHASHFLQGGGEFKDMHGVLYAPYVQDNWRVNQKLTLNLGLRWDPYWPYTEEKGRVVCYQPGAQSSRFPNAPVGMLFGGPNNDTGCPAGFGSNNNLPNFAPRVGFAYKLDSKTVVRGGGGFYYIPPSTVASNGFVDTAPFGPRFDFEGNVSFVDPFGSFGISPNPFPAQYGPSLPDSSATFTLPVSIYGTFDLNWKMAQVATWNMTVERQFGNNWVVRAAYVGNKGTHLSTAVDGGANEANPAIYKPGTCNGEPCSTADNTQDRRINPNFGAVGLYGSLYNSNYNSLQLNMEKRFSQGLSVLANYTWSKMIDNFGVYGGFNTNPFNPNFDRSVSNDDVPHVIHLSGIWQVPRFQAKGAAGGLLNGWEVTSILTWHSGFAFPIYSGSDNSFSGIGVDRADFTGTSLSQAKLDPNRSHGELIQEYFNPAFFVPNADGTFGNTGRNILRGPGFFNTDFGLIKDTRITEHSTVQFRAEFFNLFNNVNFGQPDNSVADDTIGQITSAHDPRILQFALKFLF
ncbi:MAG TPA: carboxypeptidase regulatory-like domain-containing protein [Terriglobia bacterium]|nr:carboxypeptidase regulatory-like domain-containing protein [Terriglobia bacterium]